MATDSFLITCLPDGTYHVKSTEPQGEAGDMGDAPVDKSVGSADEVIQLVQEWLQSEDQEEEGAESPDQEAAEGPSDAESAAPTDPKAAKAAQAKKAQAMWDQEAAKRGM